MLMKTKSILRQDSFWGRRYGIRAGTSEKVALIVTDLCSPIYTAAGILLVVSSKYSPNRREALAWGTLSVGFASGVPLSYILRGMRKGHWRDIHVTEREKRPRIMALGLSSVLAGAAITRRYGAPRELIALIGAMAVGLVSSLSITLFWKISIHIAVLAGAETVLVLVNGRKGLYMTPMVALAAWARVRLDDHTPAQVIAGGMVGTIVAGTVFSLLR